MTAATCEKVRPELDDSAPIVAAGFVRVGSDDASAVAGRVRSFAVGMGCEPYGPASDRDRYLTVLGVVDGTLQRGLLSWSYGPPVGVPMSVEDAGLPKYARPRATFERTLTVRAGWVGPAGHADWCHWMGSRWATRLDREMGAMTSADRAQWERPIISKGEIDPLFKVARPCFKRAPNTPKPRYDHGLRFWAEDTAEGLAMLARMRQLGAAAAERVATTTEIEVSEYDYVKRENVPRRVKVTTYSLAGPAKVAAPVSRTAAPKVSRTRASKVPAPSAGTPSATYQVVTGLVAELADTAVDPTEISHLLAAVDSLIAASSVRHGRSAA